MSGIPWWSWGVALAVAALVALSALAPAVAKLPMSLRVALVAGVAVVGLGVGLVPASVYQFRGFTTEATFTIAGSGVFAQTHRVPCRSVSTSASGDFDVDAVRLRGLGLRDAQATSIIVDTAGKACDDAREGRGRRTLAFAFVGLVLAVLSPLALRGALTGRVSR